MTPKQKSLLQSTFLQVTPVAEAVAELFYTRLFLLDPTLKSLFRGNLEEQGRKLMQMIRVAVRGLDRLEELIPVVQELGRRHVTYGVKDEHYDTVGEALLWTLGKCLREEFTPEVREAWTVVYHLLATTMRGGTARPGTEIQSVSCEIG